MSSVAVCMDCVCAYQSVLYFCSPHGWCPVMVQKLGWHLVMRGAVQSAEAGF